MKILGPTTILSWNISHANIEYTRRMYIYKNQPSHRISWNVNQELTELEKNNVLSNAELETLFSQYNIDDTTPKYTNESDVMLFEEFLNASNSITESIKKDYIEEDVPLADWDYHINNGGVSIGLVNSITTYNSGKIESYPTILIKASHFGVKTNEMRIPSTPQNILNLGRMFINLSKNLIVKNEKYSFTIKDINKGGSNKGDEKIIPNLDSLNQKLAFVIKKISSTNNSLIKTNGLIYDQLKKHFTFKELNTDNINNGDIGAWNNKYVAEGIDQFENKWYVDLNQKLNDLVVYINDEKIELNNLKFYELI